MNKHYWRAALAMLTLMLFNQGVWAQAPATASASKHWITEAASDPQRFQRIEKYLRGFDQPMWEVGERYEKLYAALLVGNLELASYHWAKIKLTIENGTMKRPARKASANALFLGDTWNSVTANLASGDQITAWKGFKTARTACMKCHEAERVGYMNDQSMFTELTPLPHNAD
jgi:cytochrome c1